MTPSGNTVGQIRYIAEIDTSKLKSSAKDADGIAKDFGDNLERNGSRSFKNFANSANNSFSSVSSTISQFAKVAGAALIGGSIGLNAFIKDASELQSIRSSFESMTGSAEQANKVLSQLNKFSFETAFSAKDINSAARTLLGAGLSVEDLGKRMQQIGDIAGATGADLGRLTLPLSQALARGKLQTQDFYQILDSGAGTLGKALREEVAKRGMGDLMSAMEDGAVTAEVLFAVMDKANKAGGFAFEGALKQSKTFAGQMSNLRETIGNVGLELIGVDKATGNIDPNGIFAKMSRAVESATKWLNQNKEVITDVFQLIIKNLVPALTAVAAAFVVAKVAAIGFAIAASPFTFLATGIAIAITALVAALVFLQLKFDIIGKTMDYFRNSTGLVRTAIDYIKIAFQTLVGIFNLMLPSIKALVATFTSGLLPALTNIWNAVFRLWQALNPALLYALGAIAAVIGGTLVAGIWLGINAFNLIINVVLWATNIFAGLIGMLAQVIQWYGNVYGAIANFAVGVIRQFDNILEKVGGVIRAIRDWWAGLPSALRTTADKITDIVFFPFKTAFSLIAKAWNNTVGKIDFKAPDWVPGLGGKGWSVPKIPELAQGGIVMPKPGGTIAKIAEAGQAEAVIPLDKLDKMISGTGGGSNSTSITVNLTGIMTDSVSGKRKVGEDIIRAVNDGLRARGMSGDALIGGGRL